MAELPNLPGYKAHRDAVLGDRSFAKRQILKFDHGYAIESLPAAQPALPRPATVAQLVDAAPAEDLAAPVESGLGVPSWVANDRKVLRWFAFFREAVVDGCQPDQQRVRRIAIHYYLVDDTLDVCEPHQGDSGIMQGMFIKRHRIEKGDGGGPLKPADFVIGSAVKIYGRVMTVVDADPFTRSHMASLGIQLAAALPYPVDPTEEYRAAFARKTTGPPAAHVRKVLETLEVPSGGLHGGSRLQKFLENSRKVLRFYAVWDDRKVLSGDRRPYVVHYYLEDDTMEVLETLHDSNSGRDQFPKFLRRARLPKDPQGVGSAPGNVDRTAPCYGVADLRIGAAIDVHGRTFFLHDCDDFTRGYYRDVVGLTAEEMAPISVVEQAQLLAPARTLPPYNGYGSLEDSAENCKGLQPRPPRKDFHRLMQMHRIVLRYSCRFHETPTHHLSPADRGRLFVLSFFMGDGSLSIFEPPQRNSGLPGGKFLERMQVCKPAASVDIAQPITELDLYVGAVVTILQRTFELLEADEFTMQYLENNKHRYHAADAELAIRSLAEQLTGRLDGLRNALAAHSSQAVGHDGQEALPGAITAAGLQAALYDLGVGMTRHQVLAICRVLPKLEGGALDVSGLFNNIAAEGLGVATSG